MILLDMFGLIISGLVLGPGYIFYVFFLSVLQEAVRLMVALAVDAQIEQVFISGIFGFTSFQGISARDLRGIMIVLAGPLILLLVYRMAGGLGRNPRGAFFNPLMRVKKPLAMVSLRFALLSLLISCWQIVRHL